MSANNQFQVVWNEDSTATVLGRIAARNGSGAATGKNGEGKFLQQGDVTTIECSVFDLDGTDPNTEIATPAVVVADAVLDTPVTTAVVWTKDAYGYNFIHNLAPTNFPTGNRRYRVEYKVTLADGTIFHGIYEGQARPLRRS